MPHEIVSFDEPKLQEYLGELVRKTVEDALNALLDAEADQIANAGRYERTDERQAYRSGCVPSSRFEPAASLFSEPLRHDS